MLKPLGDRIFLKKDPQLDKSGSIILLKKEVSISKSCKEFQ